MRSLVWDEPLQLRVASKEYDEQQLRIKLYRKSKWGDDELGVVMLYLWSFSAGYPIERWLPISDEEGAFVGEILAQIWMVEESKFQSKYPDGRVPHDAFRPGKSHRLTVGCCCVQCDPNLVDARKGKIDLSTVAVGVVTEVALLGDTLGLWETPF